ncbi:MAG: YidC/Oxa1 family membrane protein insertase [Clostridia bacterium]|nr:YidC/Oxa1 family membrane protein insertase [Clostridia bacterium]
MFELVKVPIGYLLGWIYNLIPNYGWALIVFTLAVKLLLLPLGLKQQKSMTKMQAMQPKITALQEKYKNDQQKLSQETMKLYKEYGVSPMGGCLPMLIQLPILFALYRVLYRPLTYMLHMTDKAIGALGNQFVIDMSNKNPMAQIQIAEKAKLIDFDFFGLNLSANPNAEGWLTIAMIIPVLAAVTTYFSSKVTMLMNKNKKDDKKEEKPKRILSPDQKDAKSNSANEMGQTMTWMMPIFTLWITATFPAALGIYWVASNVFSIGQTVLLNGYYANKTNKEISAQDMLIAEKKEAKFAGRKRKGKK